MRNRLHSSGLASSVAAGGWCSCYNPLAVAAKTTHTPAGRRRVLPAAPPASQHASASVAVPGAEEVPGKPEVCTPRPTIKGHTRREMRGVMTRSAARARCTGPGKNVTYRGMVSCAGSVPRPVSCRVSCQVSCRKGKSWESMSSLDKQRQLVLFS